MNHPKRKKEGQKALRRMRTIAMSFKGNSYDGHTLGDFCPFLYPRKRSHYAFLIQKKGQMFGATVCSREY
ncbi:MAG: hypothetical protein WCQ69_09310 [Bacteroidales bacterium]|nr:hypothetical protein [Bacteroidales bacterium]MDD2264944.1 hypothetical protein [Bacteroidales bacterium]MDD2832112.1 hypothetical protein [Bacteroidales bacterium]MDD3208764.1 hypothetical protein [Bacteroidales bacterium]MDD3697327.1 hypothetical protein [Bacteroidales bacterium]